MRYLRFLLLLLFLHLLFHGPRLAAVPVSLPRVIAHRRVGPSSSGFPAVGLRPPLPHPRRPQPLMRSRPAMQDRPEPRGASDAPPLPGQDAADARLESPDGPIRSGPPLHLHGLADRQGHLELPDDCPIKRVDDVAVAVGEQVGEEGRGAGGPLGGQERGGEGKLDQAHQAGCAALSLLLLPLAVAVALAGGPQLQHKLPRPLPIALEGRRGKGRSHTLIEQGYGGGGGGAGGQLVPGAGLWGGEWGEGGGEVPETDGIATVAVGGGQEGTQAAEVEVEEGRGGR